MSFKQDEVERMLRDAAASGVRSGLNAPTGPSTVSMPGPDGLPQQVPADAAVAVLLSQVVQNLSVIANAMVAQWQGLTYEAYQEQMATAQAEALAAEEGATPIEEGAAADPE